MILLARISKRHRLGFYILLTLIFSTLLQQAYSQGLPQSVFVKEISQSLLNEANASIQGGLIPGGEAFFPNSNSQNFYLRVEFGTVVYLHDANRHNAKSHRSEYIAWIPLNFSMVRNPNGTEVNYNFSLLEWAQTIENDINPETTFVRMDGIKIIRDTTSPISRESVELGNIHIRGDIISLTGKNTITLFGESQINIRLYDKYRITPDRIDLNQVKWHKTKGHLARNITQKEIDNFASEMSNLSNQDLTIHSGVNAGLAGSLGIRVALKNRAYIAAEFNARAFESGFKKISDSRPEGNEFPVSVKESGFGWKLTFDTGKNKQFFYMYQNTGRTLDISDFEVRTPLHSIGGRFDGFLGGSRGYKRKRHRHPGF